MTTTTVPQSVTTAHTFETNGVEFESRTTHFDPQCSKIDESEIVARGVDPASREAGLLCDFCSISDVPVRVPGEVDDYTPRPGSFGERRDAARRPRPEARTNRYAGRCRNCSAWVEAEAGLLVGKPGAWAVEHRAGECVEAQPEPTPTPRAERVETPEGMHRTADGTIYKAQRSRESGNVYAKRLVVVERDGAPADVSFVYERGAVSKLSAETLMSLEDAKAFGALYGTCCVCGATLTDETSIALGIGPVCGARMTEWATGVKLTAAQWRMYDAIRDGATPKAGRVLDKLVEHGLVVVDGGKVRVAG